MRRRSFFHSCFGAVAGLNAHFLFQAPKESSSHPKHRSSESNNVLVKVTGTAQDGGIPHMGCFCSNCQRAWKDPRFSRLISSLALFDFVEDKVFLVDATPDIRTQTKIIRERMGSRTKKKKFFPDGVLLTHAHIGHYTGLIH
jgi:pyrroloquinoline quinone biosynthesis protein B